MGVDVVGAVPLDRSQSPIVKIETEQKFLVDAAVFEGVKASCRRQRVRQCYVAVEGDEATHEVRFREATTIEGSCSESTYKCTLKRRRSDIARDELEFSVRDIVLNAVWTASRWRVEKDRYLGDPLGDWTVDVFTSGPLQGVFVAELEMPEDACGARFYLAEKQHVNHVEVVWPTWIVQQSMGWPTADTCEPVDLTAERVNHVAAGVVEASPRLRRLLNKVVTAASATQRPTVTRPVVPKLTRQGVRDLGHARRGGVL